MEDNGSWAEAFSCPLRGKNPGGGRGKEPGIGICPPGEGMNPGGGGGGGNGNKAEGGGGIIVGGGGGIPGGGGTNIPGPRIPGITEGIGGNGGNKLGGRGKGTEAGGGPGGRGGCVTGAEIMEE